MSDSLHSKHGCAAYVRANLAGTEPLPVNSDLYDAVRVGHFRVANVYKSPGLLQTFFLGSHTIPSMLETLLATVSPRDTDGLIKMELTFLTESHSMTFTSSMIQSSRILFILPDGNKTTSLASPRSSVHVVIHFRL